MDLGGGQQSSGDEKQYTLDLMDGKPGIEVKSPITDGLCELNVIALPSYLYICIGEAHISPWNLRSTRGSWLEKSHSNPLRDRAFLLFL
jgi:hypothetical protein